MRLPNHYNYGALFACSGIDGENLHKNDFVGMLMHQPVQVRFDAANPVTLSVDVNSDRMTVVLSDVLQSDELLLVFVD